MTLSELADRSGKSVSDIIAWALPGKAGGAKAPRPAPKKAAPKAAAGGGKSKVVNTRTPEGRAAYDEAVLQAVGSFKSPAGSSQLRKKVGGTPLQMRTALNRLIDEKKVTYEGKARATRYSLR
ncbi:MAG: hypothetical protein AAGA54_02200 [Myxococcota bacterium]